MSLTKKWVVIFIGPPGSGKGTQADLMAEKFGLIHLESSKVIENKFKTADPGDEVIDREKELWESGELNTPELVRAWMLEAIRDLNAKGLGMVLSGSPRTLFEAEGEVPLFEELYGKENVKPIHLNLSKEESIRRNSNRRICKANRHPIPNFPMFESIATCPKDGSELERRVLDNPETIGVRYEVYLRRTQPIISFLTDRSYSIIEVEGEQPIEDVFQDIIERLDD